MSKKILAFAGLLVAALLIAPSAQAATSAELEAQVQALLSQIAQLQGGASTATGCYAFTRDLTVGSQGADVSALQAYLAARGHFNVAPTGYFGAITQASVASWQSANGVMPAAGYFGPISRAKYNALCGGGVVLPPTPGDDDDDDDDDDDGELEGGAGDLESADFISNLNNEEVGEGEDAEVAGLELEADDNSDLEFTAVRIMLEADAPAADGSDELDDYAETLTVWFDGEEVGTEEVDDIDEDNGEWSTTINLDDGAIVRAGETGELVVSVVAHDNIDSDDLDDNNWNITFESVRFMDADGAVISEDGLDDIGTETREFEFSTFTSANDVELSIDDSDESPEEGTVEVDEDGDDEITLMIGEFQAEGSEIEVTELSFTVDVNGGGATTTDVSAVASEFLLMVDGEEVDSVDSDECSVPANCDGGTGDASAIYTFEDMEEVMIGEDDTVDFEIVAILNEIDSTDFPEGTSLTASVDDTDVEAEADGEDLEDDEITGGVSGEAQTFRSEGLSVDYNEDDSDADADGNVGTFEFVLDVAAFGEDVELSEADFNYTADVSSEGATPAELDEDLDASSELEEDPAGTFTVEENEDGTITFTVFISIDAADDNGVYEVTLDDVDGVVVDETLSTFIAFES